VNQNAHIILKIYNILGQEVRTLINTFQVAGEYYVVWDGKGKDGRNLSSGFYFYSLLSNNNRQWKKMLLLK